MATDRTSIRDDDKMGSVTFGGEFCLDLVQDTDQEVWTGNLTDKRWAVALLNRDAVNNATISVQYVDATVDTSTHAFFCYPFLHMHLITVFFSLTISLIVLYAASGFLLDDSPTLQYEVP